MTIQSGFCNRNISVICPQLNIFAHFLFPFISALKEVKKMVNCLKISSVLPPFCKIFFEEGWKSMLSLSPFLTLWILMEFAGSLEENILIIKVRTKREKRPRTWGMGFESLTIKMCTWEVSLKMLMSYFYESRSCIWRRSWDIRYDDRR